MLATGAVLSFFLNGVYAGLYAYTPEVFPTWNVSASAGTPNADRGQLLRDFGIPDGFRSHPDDSDLSLDSDVFGDAERAAGTGLTGHSEQQFTPTRLGPLESEATVIQLRLVIASVEAIRAAPSRPEEQPSPARPAARP